MRTIWVVTLAALGVGTAAMTLRHSIVPRTAVPQTANPPAVAGCPADAKKANLTFTLKNMDGRSVRLSDYRGKVLLLDFWATWCGPCKVEIPGFVDLYRQYRAQGFEVAGLVVEDEFSKAKPFAQAFKMNYPVLDAVDRQDIEDAFGPLWGLPTSFLISRDGRLCSKHIGLPPSHGSTDIQQGIKATFEKEIKALL